MLVLYAEGHRQRKGQDQRQRWVEIEVETYEEGALSPVNDEQELVNDVAILPEINLHANRLAVFVDLIGRLAAVLE